MSRKRHTPVVVPPADSSSEEEEEEVVEEQEEEVEDDEEEAEDELEDDNEEEAEKKNQSPKPKPKFPNSLEDEDESETDSDSGGVSIKPHAITRAKDNASVKLKKPSSKESPSPVLVKLKPAAQGDADLSGKKAKKAKSDNGGGGGRREGEEEGLVSEKKPPPFSRLFSQEDEIVILKGMIEFREKKGVDPNADQHGFLEFVKKHLSFDVSKSKLMEKVRKLKTKYLNIVKKGMDESVISKPHDLKLYKISKRIWGGCLAKFINNPVDENANNNLNQQKDERKEGKFSDIYPCLNLSLMTNNFISKDGAEVMVSCFVSIEKSKLDELEKEWEKHFLDEARVKLGRFAILQKQIQLVSDWCSRRA